jgi:ParB/RepB/Spo0J family partition protein
MSTVNLFPWDSKGPDPSRVYQLDINLINIPEPRVTSVFTPQSWQEFCLSLKSEGQKDPIKCYLVDSKIWLEDGLNRILGLKEIGATMILGIVKIGTAGDVQIGNIITARNRGRENPAQTADVIKDLYEVEKMPKDMICHRIGISKSWFDKLFNIAKLPQEIKDMVKYGKLSVASAYQLVILDDTIKQLEVATDAVNWGYTEQQTHDRVLELINPDVDPAQVQFTFGQGGAPQIIYPKCFGCQMDLKEHAKYSWTCNACLDLAKGFFEQYNKEQSVS